MKRTIPILLVLIVIVGIWLTSRFWAFAPVDTNDNTPVQEPVTGQQPEPKPDTDIDDTERLLAEEREAERLLAEQQEEERRLAELLEAERIAKREDVLEESRTLFTGYFYDEAISLLNADEDIINHETQSLEAEIKTAQSNLVRFEGDVKHIFFHSLILYPEVLFPNRSTPTGGINEGFAFQSELFLILPQLLERGYILYNINDIFSKDSNGIMRQNDIYLPPGKKPLILSIDDPSYHYGQRFVSNIGGTGGFDRTQRPAVGLANRVVRDEFGELATEVITPQRETILTYDGDVHIVVDAFVKEHPEFSFRGSKGIIAATGYMGIFGYDLPDLRNEEIRQEVIAICDKFKENGWLFASHSYSHNRTGFWGPESNPGNIRWDIKRWREEIEPLVGKTNIFIAPFGYLLRGEGMNVILDNDFDIYCTVDFNQPINVHNSHAVMGRIEIGGYSLNRYVNTLNRDFFDVASVKAPNRPPILSS